MARPVLINAYCTLRDLPPLAFAHVLKGRRDPSNPELTPHLRAFSGFVMGGGQRPMTQMRYHVLSHLERVRHHVSIELEAAQMDAFEAWATGANAIVFLPDSTVRAPDGRILVHPGTGDAEPGAEVPFPVDARQCKATHDAELSRLGVTVPATLPPVVSELEVTFRPGPMVASRCLALFACALRAESLAQGKPIALTELRDRMPRAFDALSPREQTFLGSEAPPKQDIVDHAWRYEALAILAWATGVFERQRLPTKVVDVSALAEVMLELPHDRFVEQASLRPASELLDELDLDFRLHWATTEARQRKQAPPMGLEPGVVRERHFAMNWLTGFQDAEWDDVDTPT